MSAWNLASVLAHHADRFGDRPCLVWGGDTITYAELDRRSAATAAGLAKLGVSRGDVVAILLYDCPEFIEAMFAVSRLGAVFMPINWRLAGEEVRYIATHAGARCVISEPELVPLAWPTVLVTSGCGVRGPEPLHERLRCVPNDQRQLRLRDFDS